VAELKICSNCSDYSDKFIDGSFECFLCSGEEPKIRKKYPKLTKKIFNEKFKDYEARKKIKSEKELAKRRKRRERALLF